jgi:hypothetical protein
MLLLRSRPLAACWNTNPGTAIVVRHVSDRESRFHGVLERQSEVKS